MEENPEAEIVVRADEELDGAPQGEGQESALNAFDSMISFDNQDGEEDDSSRKDEIHSAIDGSGEGERKVNWPFLTNQYQNPSAKNREPPLDGKFKMESKDFKSSIKAIVDEVAIQEKNMPLNTEIGKHYQIYLEGWKVKPRDIKVMRGEK